MEGIFVTGTDTEVGKTVISAGLLSMLRIPKKAVYWKPFQTGTIIGDDRSEIHRLTDLPSDATFESNYRFVEASAPYVAAQQAKQKIDFQKIVQDAQEKKKSGRFLIVEGAGGVLVPLTEEHLMIDFVRAISLPVVLIAPNKLGTINLVLLTIEALRARKIPILGVILNRSREAIRKGNAQCIRDFGKVDILAEVDEKTDSKSVIADISGHEALRKTFGLSVLP